MSNIYAIGKATVTKDSNIVTGSGTSWLSNVAAGSEITFDGNTIYTIGSVDSDTQLTLTHNFAEADRSNVSYLIVPNVVDYDSLLSAKLLLTADDLKTDLTDVTKYGIPQTAPTKVIAATSLTPDGIPHKDGIGEFSDITKPITPDNIAYTGNIGGVPVATILSQLSNFQTAYDYVVKASNDNSLDPVEKRNLKQGWDAIVNEYAQLQAVAFAFKSQTNFNNLSIAFWNLQKNFMTPIFADMSHETVLTDIGYLSKQNLRNAVQEYYAYREALKKELDLESSRRSLWSKIVGDSKPQDGATVGAPPGTLVGETLSEDVEAAAKDALQQVDSYFADNKIVPPEKRAMKATFDAMVADYNQLLTLSANNNEYLNERNVLIQASATLGALLVTNKYKVLKDPSHPTDLPDQSMFEDMTTTLDISSPGYEMFHNALVGYESARKNLVAKINNYTKNSAETTKTNTQLFTTLGPPTGIPNPLTISIVLRDNATRSVRLGWTYAHGQLPAEWLFLYYKKIETNGSTTITDQDPYVQLSPNTAYIDFDLDMGSAYVAGIAAARKDSVGIKKTAIQQPSFWRVEAGEYDFNGKIAGLSSTDLVTDAAYTKQAAVELAADNKLTPAEKQIALRTWTAIKSEYAALHAEATGVKYATLAATEITNYENSYQALFTYLEGTSGLLVAGSLNTTSDVNQTVFNAYIYDYYSQRTNLQKKISSIILGTAEDAKVLASNAISSAADAVSYIKGAVVDHILDEVEKSKMKSERDNAIIPEYDSLTNTATTLGITAEKTAYINAYNNLISMLNTYIDVPGNTDITGVEGNIVSVTETYYSARSALEAKFTTQTWNMAVTVQNANNVLTTNFNAQDNFNANPIVAPTNPIITSALRDNGSATATLTWTWTGNEGDIEGFIVYGRVSTVGDGYVLGSSPSTEGAIVVSANTRTFSKDFASNLFVTLGVRAYRSVDKSIAVSGRIESNLATAATHRPSSISNVSGHINNVPVGTLTTNLNYAYQFSLNMLDDLVISGGPEKRAIRADWDAFYAERSDLLARASSLNVSSTAYDTAFRAVSTDLNYFLTWTSGVPSSISDTDIDGNWTLNETVRSSMKAHWTTLISERGALLTALINKASTTSTWDGTTGPNKPADNATKNQATVSASNPSGGSNGDVHYNTATGRLWTNVNGVWTVGATQTTATAGTAAPSGGVDGDIYYNTATGILYTKVSGVWTAGATYNLHSQGTGTPSGGTQGDTYYNTTTGVLWVNNGSAWSPSADKTSLNTAADTAKVNGVASSSIAAAMINFNSSNDRNSSSISAPTGVTLSHVVKSVGTVDLTVSWAWTGVEGDIDGFGIYVKTQSSNVAYTLGQTSDIVYPVPASTRSFTGLSVAGDLWYTVGVRAYRSVDKDIAAGGLISSTITQAVNYQPVAVPNIVANINNVAATTLTDNAANGSSAYTQTSSYRQDVAPTNSPVPSAISSVNNADGTKDVTITWTYTQGTLPADGFIIYYRGDTGTVLSTDPSVSVASLSRSYTFYGLSQASTYRAGIAAFRKTETGVRTTAIAQPVSTPDWRTIGSVPNITSQINAVDSATLTGQALAGNTAASDTATFRTGGAPTNQPVIGTITASAASSAGLVNLTLNWTYTQGVLPAEEFLIYALEGTTAPTVNNSLVATAVGSARSVIIPGVPMDKSYRAGIVAKRTSKNGVETGAIVTGWARDGVVATVAATAVPWGGVSGTGKPEDYATSTTNSGNMAVNSDFLTSINGWYLGNPYGIVSAGLNLSGWTLVNSGTAYIYEGAATGRSGTWTGSFYQDFPVSGGQKYEASALSGAHRCTTFLYIDWFNSSGTNVGTNQSASNVAAATGGTYISGYFAHTLVVAAPATAVKARVYLMKQGTQTGQADSYGFFAQAQFKSAAANQTAVTGYSPGPGTLPVSIVSSSAIQDAAIVNLKIAASAVTAAKTAIAAIDPGTGNLTANSVTAANIVAGTITGDKIQAGTITSVGTVTAGSFDTTGYGRFRGAIAVGGYNTALVANDSQTQSYGIYSWGSIRGVKGDTATGSGVMGFSSGTGMGTVGQSVSGYGLYGYSGSSYALYSDGPTFINGALSMSSTTLATNLNADLLDGYHASSFALAGHTHNSYVNNSNAGSNNLSLYWANDPGSGTVALGKTHVKWLRLIIDGTTFYLPLFQ